MKYQKVTRSTQLKSRILMVRDFLSTIEISPVFISSQSSDILWSEKFDSHVIFASTCTHNFHLPWTQVEWKAFRANFHRFFPFISNFLTYRYRDPCSLSLNEDDNHTITLVGNANKRAVTLAKTCEQVNELRDCRAPRDWSILALQNTRTGKSHYLVICKCPSHFRLGEFPHFSLFTFRSCQSCSFHCINNERRKIVTLLTRNFSDYRKFSFFFFQLAEGPLPHDQPTYAGLPGINVYGMLCVPPSSPANNKWNRIGQRPAIHTSYRTKNTTIEAVVDEKMEMKSLPPTSSATSTLAATTTASSVTSSQQVPVQHWTVLWTRKKRVERRTLDDSVWLFVFSFRRRIHRSERQTTAQMKREMWENAMRMKTIW